MIDNHDDAVFQAKVLRPQVRLVQDFSVGQLESRFSPDVFHVDPDGRRAFANVAAAAIIVVPLLSSDHLMQERVMGICQIVIVGRLAIVLSGRQHCRQEGNQM